MKRANIKIVIVSALVAIAVSVGGLLFLWFGIYNVSAVAQHTQPVYDVLEFARKRSIAARVKDINVPDLAQTDFRVNGVQLYESYCTQCHGAPGIAPDAFALGMMPAPSAAAKIGAVRTAEEIFWVIANGIKMSGMPAWALRLTQQEHWQIVALLQHLPKLTRAEYQSMREQALASKSDADAGANQRRVNLSEDNEAEQGKTALIQYNCATCHNIPGITASATYVGPPLANLVRRSFVAGVLPNTDENIAAFIRHPERYKPHTLMPNMGVDKASAEAMVAYLHHLNKN